MKVAIMTRLDTIQDKHIEEYFKYFEAMIQEDLKYEIEKFTFGKHRIAQRPHTHIHHILDISNGKIYKELGQKIRSSVALTVYRKNTGVSRAISFNYNDGKKDKKGHLYDEDLILQYPLKEYATDLSMAQDLGQIVADPYKSMSGDFWKQHRNSAYEVWKNTYKHKNEIIKKDKTEKRQKLYEYLDSFVAKKIHEEDIQNHTKDDTRKHLIIVTKGILKWYKRENLQFNPMSLKSQAINYLYTTDKITEEGIIEYINI